MKPDSLRSKIQRVVRQDLGYLPESASTASINQIIIDKFGDVADIPDVADEIIADIKSTLQEASDSSSAISVTTKSVGLTQQKKEEIVLAVAETQGISQLGVDKILEIANNFSTSSTNSRAYRKEIVALFKEWAAKNLASELSSLQGDLQEISEVVNTQESILSEANNQFNNEIIKLGNQMISNYDAAKNSQSDNLGKLRLALGILQP